MSQPTDQAMTAPADLVARAERKARVLREQADLGGAQLIDDLLAEVQWLQEVVMPEKGRCEQGHHPNFVYDLTTLGGPKGCRMCELEQASQQLRDLAAVVAQVEQEMRQWEGVFGPRTERQLLQWADRLAQASPQPRGTVSSGS